MFSYALKRILRSWKLFAALLLGMTLATTFFGGINVAADSIGKQYVQQQLAVNPVDFSLSSTQGTFPPDSMSTVKKGIITIDGISGVEAHGTASAQYYSNNSTSTIGSPELRTIEDDSILHTHMTPWRSLLQGEALAVSGSGFAVGQEINYSIAAAPISQSFYRPVLYNMTLRVVGIVTLDDYAQRILLGYGGFQFVQSNGIPVKFLPITLIVSWERTFVPMLQWAYSGNLRPIGFSSTLNVFIDRNRLISPWDVEGSVATVKSISDRVANIAFQNGFQEQDIITPELGGIGNSVVFLRIPFIIFSIPVFFIAWYVGRTVSQASFNLRRKEIGLLMTKGFSRQQLYRHFLTEALLVGLIAGLVGLALGYFLNPYFVSVLSGSYTGDVVLTTTTAVTTGVFALFLTVIAIRSPASKAAAMDPAQALREYIYVEDVTPSRRRGPIIAFSLGLYKLVLLLLGISIATLTRSAFSGGFFTAILFLILTPLDFALTFVGPFLFLYGAANLSSGLALRFHRRFSSISKRLIGDVATLASNSVFRNPKRAASTVFLVALIAGYSIWVIGDLASMEDFSNRQTLARVGADIRIAGFSSLSNATWVSHQLSEWGNVSATSPEASFSMNTPGGGQMTFRAIDPYTWRGAAFYEDGWFSGGNSNYLFDAMKSDNLTIVLDHGVAAYYNIAEDGSVLISSQSTQGVTLSLRVVGFLGPNYSSESSQFITPFGGGYFQPLGWSYVPISLVSLYPGVFSSNSGSFSVLAKANGVSADSLASSIQTAFPYLSVTTTSSGNAALQGLGFVFTGLLNVLRLGTVFAAAVAGIGVGTVAYTGFKEREKETTMVAVRGLSYKQLLGLLVTEVLPLVIFALILAVVVGLITVRGDTLALDALSGQDFYALLSPRRIIFPLFSQLMLATITGLLLAGVFVPAIFAARKNLSRISRTVRFG